MNASSTALIALCVVSCGCVVGPSLKSFGPATSPFGSQAVVRDMQGNKLEGELLALSDSAIVVLTAEPKVIIFRYASLRFVKVKGVRRIEPKAVDGWRPPEWFSRDAGLRSRWPQGMRGNFLSALLAHHGLDAAEVR